MKDGKFEVIESSAVDQHICRSSSRPSPLLVGSSGGKEWIVGLCEMPYLKPVILRRPSKAGRAGRRIRSVCEAEAVRLAARIDMGDLPPVL